MQRVKYLETFKNHQQECNMKLGDRAQSEVKNAEFVKVELEKVKQELGSAVELKTIDDAINEAVLEIRASKEMKNKR